MEKQQKRAWSKSKAEQKFKKKLNQKAKELAKPKISDENLFKNVLMKFLELEFFLESKRAELFIKNKFFNFIDAFEILDKSKKGEMKSEEFIKSL